LRLLLARNECTLAAQDVFALLCHLLLVLLPLLLILLVLLFVWVIFVLFAPIVVLFQPVIVLDVKLRLFLVHLFQQLSLLHVPLMKLLLILHQAELVVLPLFLLLPLLRLQLQSRQLTFLLGADLLHLLFFRRGRWRRFSWERWWCLLWLLYG